MAQLDGNVGKVPGSDLQASLFYMVMVSLHQDTPSFTMHDNTRRGSRGGEKGEFSPSFF